MVIKDRLVGRGDMGNGYSVYPNAILRFVSFIVWKRKKKYRIFFENESKHRVRVGKEITEEAGIDKYLFDKMLYTITLLYTISLHLE